VNGFGTSNETRGTDAASSINTLARHVETNKQARFESRDMKCKIGYLDLSQYRSHYPPIALRVASCSGRNIVDPLSSPSFEDAVVVVVVDDNDDVMLSNNNLPSSCRQMIVPTTTRKSTAENQNFQTMTQNMTNRIRNRKTSAACVERQYYRTLRNSAVSAKRTID
jgi:hypothetical protein